LKKKKASSQGGGVHPLHPLPRSAPGIGVKGPGAEAVRNDRGQ